MNISKTMDLLTSKKSLSDRKKLVKAKSFEENIFTTRSNKSASRRQSDLKSKKAESNPVSKTKVSRIQSSSRSASEKDTQSQKSKGKVKSPKIKTFGKLAEDIIDNIMKPTREEEKYFVLWELDGLELLQLEAKEMEEKLKSIFKLKPDTDLIDATILDCYVAATHWSKEQRHTAQQLTGFFDIVYKLLEKIREENLSRIDSFIYFRNLLKEINENCSQNSDDSRKHFFNEDESRAITKYLHDTLFQHFQLYELMFSKKQPKNTLKISNNLPVETPYCPPLDEGIDENILKLSEKFDLQSTYNAQIRTKASLLIDAVSECVSVAPCTSNHGSLPPQVEDIFAKLTPEDVKSIVDEISKEVLESLQDLVGNKFRRIESKLSEKINNLTSDLCSSKSVRFS